MNNNKDCDVRWMNMVRTDNLVLHQEKFDVFVIRNGNQDNLPAWRIYVQEVCGNKRFAGGNKSFSTRSDAKAFVEKWLLSRKNREEIKMMLNNKAQEAANILREWQDAVKPVEKKNTDKAVGELHFRDVPDWASWEIPTDKYGERLANTLLLVWKDEAHKFLKRSYGGVMICAQDGGYVYYQQGYSGNEMYQFCGDKPVVFEYLNQAVGDVYNKISDAVDKENERLESTMKMLAVIESYNSYLSS